MERPVFGLIIIDIMRLLFRHFQEKASLAPGHYCFCHMYLKTALCSMYVGSSSQGGNWKEWVSWSLYFKVQLQLDTGLCLLFNPCNTVVLVLLALLQLFWCLIYYFKSDTFIGLLLIRDVHFLQLLLCKDYKNMHSKSSCLLPNAFPSGIKIMSE